MLAAGGGRELPDYDAVSAWLGDHLPQDAGDPALVHGDFKLDNVILDPVAGPSPRWSTGRWPRSAIRWRTSATCSASVSSRASRCRSSATPRDRAARLAEPRGDGRPLRRAHRPAHDRPALLRDAGRVEAGDPAGGVVPPAPGRHDGRPVLRHAGD